MCQYIFFLCVSSAAFLWYLPFCIIIYSVLGCLATLITDYSVCLLLCNLAWHTFQGYILSSFRFSILSQGTVSFIFQFVYMSSLYFYGEGCHSSVDEDSRDIMPWSLVCKYQSTWHLFPEDWCSHVYFDGNNEWENISWECLEGYAMWQNLISKIRKIIEWHDCVLSSLQLPCNTSDGCRSEQHSEDTEVVWWSCSVSCLPDS